ncbi:hypothetical protein P0Y31_12150 [Knoellia sp. 3-2P3]|uniref:hypothetical protein n=1 Tax=unclassified Knoellia TaxID=2618719 RepID=UPI0023DAA6B8|nr:hypothetical protein [Knoellia sp. 3-2P3]MDF2093096.1 hypothetical protein [Knoellia sp. 3-2P3]
MAWLYELAGPAAVAWTRGVGILLLGLMLMIFLAKVCSPWLAAGLALASLAACWPWLTERPQLAGFVLLVPAVGAWWQSAADLEPRWWLVPLTWLAACTHGVWFMGLAFGGLVVLGLLVGGALSVASFKRLGILLGACTAAAALTPLGPNLLLTPISVGSNGRQFVAEWMPSSVRTPAVALALVMLAATWLLWLVGRQRPPAWQLLAFCAATTFSLAMQRTVPLAAIIAAFLLAGASEQVFRQRSVLTAGLQIRAVPSVVGLWVGAAALASIAAVPLANVRGQEVTGVPIALEERLQGLAAETHLLSYGDATGWLMFTAPQVRPVFDLRIEQYSPAQVHRFIDAMQAKRGWEQFISDTGTQAALLESDSPLTAALTEQLQWQVSAGGSGFVLLEAPS